MRLAFKVVWTHGEESTIFKYKRWARCMLKMGKDAGYSGKIVVIKVPGNAL